MLSENLTSLFFISEEFTKRMLSLSLLKLVRCLLYTSDAADERSSVDLGGRRIIKKKKRLHLDRERTANT